VKVHTSNNSETFGLLVIGELGEFANKSLQSMLQSGVKRFCYLSDSVGDKWIRAQLADANGIKLCRHFNAVIDTEVTGLGPEGDYVEFGEKKFFLLKILKWLLIKDMWQSHSELDFVIFSDFDVAWKSTPNLRKIFEDSSKAFLAIQDDSRNSNDRFFCPGIMIWRKSPRAIMILDEIDQFQKSRIDEGEWLPDDKALNFYLKQNGLYELVIPLPDEEYVIGHRLLHLMLGIGKFKLRKMTAFHANYAKGNDLKLKFINASQINTFSLKRFYFIALLLLTKLRLRIFRI